MTVKQYMSGVLTVLFFDNTDMLKKISFAEECSFDDIDSYTGALSKESTNLDKNQKSAFFCYVYLYCMLTGLPQKFEQAFRCSDLPEKVTENYKLIITQDRIDYIKKDYSQKGIDFIELFNNPDDYIADLVTSSVNLPVPKNKTILKNLDQRIYEHAEDRAALRKLAGNKALETVIKLYSKYSIEKLITIHYTGSNIKVTNENIPYLYNMLAEACRILDIKEIPELYIEQGLIGAVTIGSDKPIIILSNACLSMLTYDELMFVIGHELGHIKSRHSLYHTIGSFLPGIAEYIGNFTFGAGNLISSGLSLLLENWHRKSEFTADRAGLLVCQNYESAISTMYKIAGYPPKFYNQININDFLAQAKLFRDIDNDTYGKAIKLLSAAENSHPWTVMRAYELDKWTKDGRYNHILELFSNSDTPKSNVQKCPVCGYEYEEGGVRFCKKCGHKL